MSTKTHLEDAKVYTDLRGATLHIGGSLHTGIGDINVDHEGTCCNLADLKMIQIHPNLLESKFSRFSVICKKKKIFILTILKVLRS